MEPLQPCRTPTAPRVPAVLLLLERAGSVTPGSGDPSRTRPTPVVAICHSPRGNPARPSSSRPLVLAPVGPVESLLDRLDEWMLSGGRDPPRAAAHDAGHAGLEADHLLTGEEQAGLRLLSVFVGGFTLDDVEELVAHLAARRGHGTRSSAVLEALAEQSLPLRDGPRRGPGRCGTGCSSRWRSMPVPGWTEAGEWNRVSRAHAAPWFFALAEENEPRLPATAVRSMPWPALDA